MVFVGSLLTLIVLILLARAGRIRRARVGPVNSMAADPELSQRVAEALSEIVRYKTVSYGAQGDFDQWVRMREHLKRRFPLAHDAMTREVVGAYSVLYRWAGRETDEEPILFCAHMDVVPAEEGWQHGPFDGDIADEQVWGRGSLDCKSLLVCLLEAVESLVEQGFVPTRDIWFAFGHDEEVGGEDGAGSISRLFAARNMHFAMILDEGGGLKRGLLSLRRPVAEVAVSEKGMMNVRLTAQSGGGHASDPPRHTAAGSLSEAVCRVEFKPRSARLTPLVYDKLKALAPYLSFGWRLRVANRWLLKGKLAKYEPAWVRTTIAPTMLSAGKAFNVLPGKAEAMLNIRLLPGDDPEDILRYLRDLFSGLGVSVMAMSIEEPSKISEYVGEAFRAVSSSVRIVFGDVPVVPSLMTAATDARRYENFSDCVYRFFPFVLGEEELAGIHGVDEHVSIEALGRAVLFYRELIGRMAGQRKSSLELTVDGEEELFGEPQPQQ